MGPETAVGKAVLRHLSQSGRVLSLDVFDTLLLRDCRPELARLLAVSRAQAAALRAAGHGVTGRGVCLARLTAQKRAYDKAGAGDGGDPAYDDLARPMCRMLGLPDVAGGILLEAETVWDLAHVRANRRLVSVLRTAVDGVSFPPRIVGVSDMYLPEASIRRLLAAHVPDLAAMPLFVSCQAGASKRSGRLFAMVADALGVEGSAFLHIGDQADADGLKAVAAGWNSLVVPRGRLCRMSASVQDRAIRWGLRRWPALRRALDVPVSGD